MKKQRNWRAIFTWALFGFSLLYVLPSVVSMPSWYPFTKEIRGGLDLGGGLELRYTVDWKHTLEDATRKTAESLQLRIADELAKKANENYADLPTDKQREYKAKIKVEVLDIDRATLTLADQAAWDVYSALDAPMDTIDERFEVNNDSDTRVIELLLPDRVGQEIRQQVVAETRDNLEKRVGGMGLIDPDVRITGDSDIAVQVPGVGKEQMDVVRSVLGRTAQLTMRFVDDDNPWLATPEVAAKVEEFKKNNPNVQGMEVRTRAKRNECSTYNGTVKAPNKGDLARFVRTLQVPATHFIGFEYCEDTNAEGVVVDRYWQAVYLHAKVELTGNHLSRARISFSQEGKPAVSLDMNGEGAQLFSDATERNVGEMLAIMLDEDIQSAPVIKQKIGGGRAEITMGRGGNRAFREAEALSEVLNQGAYQAPVYKVHDHDVGPSLGRDSVSAGATSLIVGLALIIAFLVFYYRWAGAIAAATLGLNVLLIFMLLVSFNTALTLPGIAGIILTIGMAVDGNIIIFERIREELRAGKTPRVAVDAGFGKAFSAIIDGNLTTAITGLTLMNFTSGPIHNFAVTLLLGLMTSVFTAVFVSRLIFNWWLAAKKPAKLSI
ncbi:MAG TPA: protein translocase subunit SecD [Myxococcota bacterium]|nr:protein translocase subunit SecD [Myxococcota bacterium]